MKNGFSPQMTQIPLRRISVPTPFEVGPVNLYLITEPEMVLIDTGPSIPRALERLEQQFDVSKVRKIIITHAHQDHYGLARRLVEISGATVYASPLERAQLAGDPELQEFYHQLLEKSGMTPAMMARQREQFDHIRATAEPLRDFRFIDELETISCGAATFRPIATPGHTAGSISLWEAERRILIAADTVIKRITPNPFASPDDSSPTGRFPSLRAYLATLEKIRALNPAIIHCGHGEPVEDFGRHMEWLMTHHRNRQEAVRSCLRRKPHTPQEIAECLFPEPAREGSFLALCEVFAHVDLLEELGEASHKMHGPGAVYSLK